MMTPAISADVLAAFDTVAKQAARRGEQIESGVTAGALRARGYVLQVVVAGTIQDAADYLTDDAVYTQDPFSPTGYVWTGQVLQPEFSLAM